MASSSTSNPTIPSSTANMDAPPGRKRSFPNLQHLSLAPLSSQYPLEPSSPTSPGSSSTSPDFRTPRSSYLAPQTAPPSPGILSLSLSRSSSRHRQQNRSHRSLVYLHDAYIPPSSSSVNNNKNNTTTTKSLTVDKQSLPKAKSSSALLAASDNGPLPHHHKYRRSARSHPVSPSQSRSSSTAAAKRSRHRTRQPASIDTTTTLTADAAWLARTAHALALTGGASNGAPPSWLAHRAAITAPPSPHSLLQPEDHHRQHHSHRRSRPSSHDDLAETAARLRAREGVRTPRWGGIAGLNGGGGNSRTGSRAGSAANLARLTSALSAPRVGGEDDDYFTHAHHHPRAPAAPAAQAPDFVGLAQDDAQEVERGWGSGSGSGSGSESESDDVAATEEEEEEEIERLVREGGLGGLGVPGLGLGSWVDRLVGWTLFSGREDGGEDGDGHGEEGGEGHVRGQETREEEGKEVRRGSGREGAEREEEEEGGGWQDVAWLLSVASKVLL